MSKREEPSPSQFAGCIADYFSKNQARTAQVLAGPNRETWFSAGVFVALCRATKAMAGNEWCLLILSLRRTAITQQSSN